MANVIVAGVNREDRLINTAGKRSRSSASTASHARSSEEVELFLLAPLFLHLLVNNV